MSPRHTAHDAVQRARAFWRTYLTVRGRYGATPNAINVREQALRWLEVAREVRYI